VDSHALRNAFFDSHVLGDFYSAALEYAPYFLRANAGAVNAPDRFTLIPTGDFGFPQNNALLIRDDIYAQHVAGRGIHNATDLELLLRLVSFDNPGIAPGVMSLQGVPDANFDLARMFLPEMGFTLLEGLLGQPGFLWMDENRMVYPLHDLQDELAVLSMRFMGWLDEGLVRVLPQNTLLWHPYNRQPDERLTIFPAHPLVLTSTTELHWIAEATRGEENAFMEGYTLYILPSGMPHTVSPRYAAMAMWRTDISEFLRFMESMNSEDEH